MVIKPHIYTGIYNFICFCMFVDKITFVSTDICCHYGHEGERSADICIEVQGAPHSSTHMNFSVQHSQLDILSTLFLGRICLKLLNKCSLKSRNKHTLLVRKIIACSVMKLNKKD